MRPAFSHPRYAAAFALLLIALIAAPWAVARLGLLDRATAWEVLPEGAGPAAHIEREIYDETGDIDIVFIGSSLMWSGIDAPYMQAALSDALGRQATVRVIATVWPGLDRDYALLRDLLDRRHVGLVVLQMPHRNRPTLDAAAEVNRVSDQPHVQAYRFYREGEFPEVLPGLAPRSRVALYAEAVLGMPRHLLTLLRPNELSSSPVEATLGSRFQQMGFYGEPYVDFERTPPLIPANQMIYGRGADYQFFEEPLPPYQTHFVRLIGATLAEHRVPAVLLHIPQANELDADTVEERENWPELIGTDVAMIGVPPTRLFGGFSDDDTLKFFSSDHLNENGAHFFTRAVAPALLDIYRTDEEAR